MKRCLIMFLFFITALMLSVMVESTRKSVDQDIIVIASEDISSEILQNE